MPSATSSPLIKIRRPSRHFHNPYEIEEVPDFEDNIFRSSKRNGTLHHAKSSPMLRKKSWSSFEEAPDFEDNIFSSRRSHKRDNSGSSTSSGSSTGSTGSNGSRLRSSIRTFVGEILALPSAAPSATPSANKKHSIFAKLKGDKKKVSPPTPPITISKAAAPAAGAGPSAARVKRAHAMKRTPIRNESLPEALRQRMYISANCTSATGVETTRFVAVGGYI